MNRFFQISVILTGFMMAGAMLHHDTASAAVIMIENWNSGGVDTTRWEYVGFPVISSTVNLGGGDWALKLQNGWGECDSGLRSRFGLSRGENLRCTFRIWRDDEQLAAKALAQTAGDVDRDVKRRLRRLVRHWNFIGGPFVNRNYLLEDQPQPGMAQIEAGFSRYAPIQGPGGMYWAEGVETPIDTGARVEAPFLSAWMAATDKSRALWVRITLGNTTGARCEWSADGAGWTTLKLSNGQPINTIGLPAGSNGDGAYSGEYASCKVGARSPVWIFFGSASNLSTYVDDVVVENDAAKWTPPPTPTPPPRAADVFTMEMIEPKGRYYQATVPDTLDLAERARLAVHGLTSFLDPAMNYGPWGHFSFDNPRPALLDRLGGPVNWGKIAEVMIRTRMMSGSREGLDNELRSLKGMVEHLTPCRINADAPCPVARVMIALNWLYLQSLTPAMRDLINAYGQAHMNAARNSGDYSCYAQNVPNGDRMYADRLHEDGTAARALTFWGTTSGQEQYVNLAGRLSRGMMLPEYWVPEADAKLIVPGDRGHFMGHMHSYLCGMMGMSWYADAARDDRVMGFVRDAYEYERNFGVARVGMFGEGCNSGDMTQVAVRLSESGAGDYWEDVDCYVRNHLTELQLTDAALLQKAISTMHGTYADGEYGIGDRDYGTGAADIINRILGTVTDDGSHLTKFAQISADSTICGPGNVIAGLCCAWDAIVRCVNGEAQINLLLNRASPWLHIDSYLPYEGKVVIHNKTAHRVAVRIPRWASKPAVQIKIGKRAVTPSWVANYLILDAIHPKDQIIISFPIMTRVEKYTVKWKINENWHESSNPGNDWTNPNPITYTMTFKGNTLVDVSPRDTGPGLPIYQRDAMRDGTVAPMKTVTRFVADVTAGVGRGRIDLQRSDEPNI